MTRLSVLCDSLGGEKKKQRLTATTQKEKTLSRRWSSRTCTVLVVLLLPVKASGF